MSKTFSKINLIKVKAKKKISGALIANTHQTMTQMEVVKESC